MSSSASVAGTALPIFILAAVFSAMVRMVLTLSVKMGAVFVDGSGSIGSGTTGSGTIGVVVTTSLIISTGSALDFERVYP